MKLNGDYPVLRSIEGKCGALITALKILEEKGYSKKEEFINNYLTDSNGKVIGESNNSNYKGVLIVSVLGIAIVLRKRK